MKIIRSLLLLAVALVAMPALADTSINQTHALAPDAHLSISNVAGSVTIQTWDKHEVRLTGTLGRNSKLKLSGDENDLSIKIKNTQDGDSGWFGHDDMGPTTLKLMVPRSVNLSVDTVSAEITATGLAGGKLDLNTVSGNLRVDADSPHVKANSVSGDMQLSGHAASLDVNTVSGDVQVDKAGSQAMAQTVSGQVEMQGGPFHEVSVETVSGDIVLDGSMASDVSAKLHSMSGDIRLSMSGSPQGSLNATSFSGDIRSAFGTVSEPAHGPGSSLHVKLGNGDGDITLNSFSGDIHIRKGD
jgi:DUF4097 and DUF4098 domain-containing protein YvlB